MARVILTVVALHILVIGGLLSCGSAFRASPALGLSADDESTIQAFLDHIAPPRPVWVRLRNATRQAVLTFRGTPESFSGGDASQRQPVMIEMILVTPDHICLVTQLHGSHVFDRRTQSWDIQTDENENFSAESDAPREDEQPETTLLSPTIASHVLPAGLAARFED